MPTREKYGFITKYELFEFMRMGFGPCNAPAMFARAINLVLRRLNWKIALAFLDDVLILGESTRAHLDNLQQVFERFRHYGVKFKPRKCEFFQQTIEFLGRSVSSEGVEMGDQYIEAVRDFAETLKYEGSQNILRLRKLSPELYPLLFRSRSPAICHSGQGCLLVGK